MRHQKRASTQYSREQAKALLEKKTKLYPRTIDMCTGKMWMRVRSKILMAVQNCQAALWDVKMKEEQLELSL